MDHARFITLLNESSKLRVLLESYLASLPQRTDLHLATMTVCFFWTFAFFKFFLNFESQWQKTKVPCSLLRPQSQSAGRFLHCESHSDSLTHSQIHSLSHSLTHFCSTADLCVSRILPKTLCSHQGPSVGRERRSAVEIVHCPSKAFAARVGQRHP